jgi:hypothetical protein
MLCFSRRFIMFLHIICSRSLHGTDRKGFVTDFLGVFLFLDFIRVYRHLFLIAIKYYIIHILYSLQKSSPTNELSIVEGCSYLSYICRWLLGIPLLNRITTGGAANCVLHYRFLYRQHFNI